MQPAHLTDNNRGHEYQLCRQPRTLPPSSKNQPLRLLMPLTRSTSQVKFPKLLYEILSNPQYHQAICWMPHGRSWRVCDRDAFKETVCKRYLKINYGSFMKNVNSWGFRRIKKKGNDFGSYYHPCFQRDSPNEVAHMWRLKVGRGRGSCNENSPIHAYPPVTVALSGPEIFHNPSATDSSNLMAHNIFTPIGKWVPAFNPHPIPMPMFVPPLLPLPPPPHAGYWCAPPLMSAVLVIHPLPKPMAPSGYAKTVPPGNDHEQDMNKDF